jgi:lipopolysaccharide transport system permease protein
MNLHAKRPPLLTIRNHTPWRIQLAELWHYRELFGFLVWRDIKIHYSQLALGVLWVILQPMLTMAAFTLFFGRLAPLAASNVPYSLYVLCGLLPWIFFANGFNLASASLALETQLIKKVYFPRALIPLAKIFGGLLDLAIGWLLLSLWASAYGYLPTWRWMLLPMALLQLLLAVCGVSLLFAALNTLYRDIKHVATFLIQLWMFASPVVYPLTLIPKEWQLYYAFNPMVLPIEAFRWIVLGETGLTIGCAALSAFSAYNLLLGGWLYFSRVQQRFADI